MEVSAKRNADNIPYSVTKDGKFDTRGIDEPNWWTNGVWPALMWLMYVGTDNEMYKEIAQNAEDKLDRALEYPEKLSHDVSFLWNISSGVNYRLTGNIKSKRRWSIAAALMAGRYNTEGGFIRAWEAAPTESRAGYTIIDCLMNIPILYRAAKELGEPQYEYIAKHQADKTIEDHLRGDGSVVHIADHDLLDGHVIRTLGGQGYGVGSSWSRGQAWGIYGFMLSYIYTGEEKYLNAAKQIAHYFIASVCDDYLPKCDFRSPKEPVIYDSTAGAIAVCGLIEIARVVPEYEKSLYLNAAMNILKAMEAKFCNWDKEKDGILHFGTELYGEKSTHNIFIIYGDLFFAEALLKLKNVDFLLW